LWSLEKTYVDRKVDSWLVGRRSGAAGTVAGWWGA